MDGGVPKWCEKQRIEAVVRELEKHFALLCVQTFQGHVVLHFCPSPR